MTNAELIATLRGENYFVTLLHDAADALEAADEKIADCVAAIDALDDSNDAYIKENERLKKRTADLEAQLPKEGEWIMDENPHDGDCRCSACLVAIDAMHERNHGLLNALTGGKWWKFYRYCPNCGAKMKGANDGET